MGEQASYESVLKANQISDFRDFVDKYLVRDSARLTIEMFAGEVTVEEQAIVMDAALAVNQRAYEINTLAQIAAMKNE